MKLEGRPATGRAKTLSYRQGRSKKLCIRVSERDLKRLELLTNFYGMTKTDYILSCIEDGFVAMRREIEAEKANFCTTKNQE